MLFVGGLVSFSFFSASLLANKGANKPKTAQQEKGMHLYKIDPVHTFVLFKVGHQGFSSSYGRFLDVSGTISLNEDKPKETRFEIVIKTASLDTQHKKRDKHLRGPDFFNVKQFPSITFKSKKVKSLGGKFYTIIGDLNFRNKTKKVTLKFERFRTGKDHLGTHRTGGETEFVLRRSEFGMNYMMSGETAISDEVKVIVSIEAIRQSS